jgi:hypothetical protein
MPPVLPTGRMALAARMLGLLHNRWTGELLLRHLLSTTLDGRMLIWFVLPASAGLLHLEFQAAGPAFKDISLAQFTAVRHFQSPLTV